MANGIIEQKIDKNDPFKALSYDPKKAQINPATDTVEGRIGNIVSSGSPLMKQAETRALQGMNARGLINSSMAVGAGQSALYDAALPIAQQDASMFHEQRIRNQDAENQALQFTADAGNRVNLQNLQGRQQMEQASHAAELEKGLISARTESESRLQSERSQQALEGEKQLTQLRGQIEMGLQELRGTQSQTLAEIEANSKALIQTNDSAGKLYQQALDAINKTLLNPELGPRAKQAAIDRQVELLRSGLSLIGSVADLDLASLLDFESVTAERADTKVTKKKRPSGASDLTQEEWDRLSTD